MTTMTEYRHDQNYQRGYDAANRALDRTTLTAMDLLTQAEVSCRKHEQRGNRNLAEWNRGFATAIREFLDDKGC